MYFRCCFEFRLKCMTYNENHLIEFLNQFFVRIKNWQGPANCCDRASRRSRIDSNPFCGMINACGNTPKEAFMCHVFICRTCLVRPICIISFTDNELLIRVGLQHTSGNILNAVLYGLCYKSKIDPHRFSVSTSSYI